MTKMTICNILNILLGMLIWASSYFVSSFFLVNDLRFLEKTTVFLACFLNSWLLVEKVLSSYVNILFLENDECKNSSEVARLQESIEDDSGGK